MERPKLMWYVVTPSLHWNRQSWSIWFSISKYILGNAFETGGVFCCCWKKLDSFIIHSRQSATKYEHEIDFKESIKKVNSEKKVFKIDKNREFIRSTFWPRKSFYWVSTTFWEKNSFKKLRSFPDHKKSTY